MPHFLSQLERTTVDRAGLEAFLSPFTSCIVEDSLETIFALGIFRVPGITDIVGRVSKTFHFTSNSAFGLCTFSMFLKRDKQERLNLLFHSSFDYNNSNV